jgi:hypothetical protein
MGQRHQLFVIAKIGARYRGLAAIHHQWLYGATALKVCRRLLHIFQSPENRVALEHELRWAKTLGENDWDADEPYIPFPFILTCLVLGASFNEKEGYYYKVQRLPFNLPFDEGDNNDGITVLDISDLGNVKYCFVDYQGMESAREVEMMTPVEASEYLWAYYDEGNEQFQRAFGELVKTFKGRDLVDARALDSAWPSDDWKERGGGKHPKGMRHSSS